ncbi:MAG: hypothetical protein HRU31_00260 [Rhodobacteraceae bacterium]|nr:hypothetical protein [Paracoccaceae bacterium]
MRWHRPPETARPIGWRNSCAACVTTWARTRKDARLIARELLDNPDRAAKSRTWYLRDFLDRAIALAEGLPGGETLPED